MDSVMTISPTTAASSSSLLRFTLIRLSRWGALCPVGELWGAGGALGWGAAGAGWGGAGWNGAGSGAGAGAWASGSGSGAGWGSGSGAGSGGVSASSVDR